MADSIRITTQTLVDTAKEVRRLNNDMDDKLKNINSTMNSLESTWKSDAATDIRAAMDALKPRFEEYKSVVEAYAAFLDRTAQSYESTESAIQTNAGAFK